MTGTSLTLLRVPSSPSRQLALVTAALVLLSVIGVALWWLLRPDYQVLFAELRPGDAATFAAELDRRKVRYRFSDDERTLLVAGEDPRALRVKLMSQDLPVKGSVGFELFNNSSFGLTEFAQKVNYQRALQGELARTIAGLAEVDSARVHLSMPESSLFRRAGNRAKASVAVTLRGNAELEPATVRGIQRLVAAAVPELEVHDVTVLDARGVVAGKPGSSGASGDPKLDLKLEVEQYYVRKILDQLEPMFGARMVSVSVEALINHDQIRITQETSGTRGARPARIAVGNPADGPSEPAVPVPAPAAEGNSRRIEQIVAETGNLRRLSIAMQLPVPQDAAQLDRLKAYVAAAVGLNAARGDVITVLVRERGVAPPERALEPVAAAPAELPRTAAAPVAVAPAMPAHWWIAIAVLALTVLSVAGWWWRSRATRPLSDDERLLLAQRLKTLLAKPREVPHGVDAA